MNSKEMNLVLTYVAAITMFVLVMMLHLKIEKLKVRMMIIEMKIEMVEELVKQIGRER